MSLKQGVAQVRTLLGSAWVIASLSILLVYQIAVRDWTPPQLGGPTPGTLIPDLTVGRAGGGSDVGLRALVSTGLGCSLLVLVSPSCPVCARMRTTWPIRFAKWTDSVGVPVQPIWLSEGGGEAFDAFTSGFTLEGITRTFLRPETSEDAFRALGVIGTPTLYLVNSEGVVQAGLVGDLFPPVDIARRACDVG